jgi:hypothetical protein
MLKGKCTVRDYGGRYVEASWGVSREGSRIQTEKGEGKNREENIERARRRAKAGVRRKCMAAGLDHLLTLTYRDNMVDKEESFHDFESFVRLVHGYIRDWTYVAVSERQERGAIHFHIGVKGFQDVVLLRSLWRKIAGEGNIDVNYVKTKKGLTWKRHKLATYLAKYVGKEMNTELNERRFRASPGITIPTEVFYAAWHTVKDITLSKVETLGGKVAFVWSPEESNGLYGWACSWG